MTPAEFDTAASRTRLRKRAREMARLVLCDGLSHAEAARRAGCAWNTVRAAVARIEREHKGIVGCPPGWRVYSVCLPLGSEAAEDVREIERRELRRAGLLV